MKLILSLSNSTVVLFSRVSPKVACSTNNATSESPHIKTHSNIISRHMVVCHAAKQASIPHCEYIDRNKFSCICSSVLAS